MLCESILLLVISRRPGIIPIDGEMRGKNRKIMKECKECVTIGIIYYSRFTYKYAKFQHEMHSRQVGHEIKTGPKTGPKNRTDDYIGLVS